MIYNPKCPVCGSEIQMPDPAVKSPSKVIGSGGQMSPIPEVGWETWSPNVVCDKCGTRVDSVVREAAKVSPAFQAEIGKGGLTAFAYQVLIIVAFVGGALYFFANVSEMKSMKPRRVQITKAEHLSRPLNRLKFASRIG